jgi:molecular chaperone GrpE (heat shock protein)
VVLLYFRELQKLLAEERRLKDQQEHQIQELRTKLTQSESQSGQREQYEKKLRDVCNELEATRRKLKRAEAKTKETPPFLLQLQEEMANMKLQHQAAIFEVVSIEWAILLLQGLPVLDHSARYH